jgi:hypothetical protein
MVWWDDYEAEQLPLVVRTGFSFEITQLTLFAADWEKRYYRKALQDTADDKAIAHFGIEQNLGKILQLRAGIYGPDLNDNETTHFTAGFGYQQNKYSLSLAGEKYRLNQTDVFRYLFSLDLPM